MFFLFGRERDGFRVIIVRAKRNMCYLLYLTTDSRQELTQYNNELVKLEKVTEKDEEIPYELLTYSNTWYVGSSTGCSCGFRHLGEISFGFSGPVDWYEEDEEDIRATKHIYRIFKQILSEGNKVECVDKWAGTAAKKIKTLDVSLAQVSCEEFRFFENHKFILTL